MQATDAAARGMIDTYAVVRAVGRPDSPFDGRLARGADGRTVLLVDRDALEEWPGWSASGGEHLLAPLDVVRRDDGHDVVLPHPVERLDRFVDRRSDGSPFSDGELVTLAVSLLRGLGATLARGTAAEPGEWWLTDDARPMLIEGIGQDSARRATTLVLEAVAASTAAPAANVVTRVAGVITDEGIRSRDLDVAEDELFALASAEALATEVIAPRRVRSRVPAATAPDSEAETAPRGVWHTLVRTVDANLADTTSDALHAVWQRLRRRGVSRRRPLLWAAGLGVAVLAVGLMWPTGEDPSAAFPGQDSTPVSVDPSQAVPSPQEPAQTPHDESTPTDESADDPESALAELLTTWATCGESCAPEILEEPSRPPGQGLLGVDPAQLSIGLVDDLGGLAVLRVESPHGAAAPHLVTMVQQDDGWRIRDVYEAADPPA